MITLDKNNTVFKFNTAEQNIFFTSDTHFFHKNIIRYCNRPFSSIEEMNNTIIDNWNNTVKENDIVFHLGDFAFCGSAEYKSILDRLNGKIYLIIGNHDWKNIKQGYINRFEGVYQQMAINIDGQAIYLNHFPFLCFAGAWREIDRCTWQLFGHVHSGPYTKTGLDIGRLINLLPTQYDVGVDNNNYTPISFYNVKNIIHNQIMSLNMDRGDINDNSEVIQEINNNEIYN